MVPGPLRACVGGRGRHRFLRMKGVISAIPKPQRGWIMGEVWANHLLEKHHVVVGEVEEWMGYPLG